MRIKDLQKILKDERIDGLILINQDPNIAYFSEIHLENTIWTEHCEFLIDQKSKYLAVRELESQRVSQNSNISIVKPKQIQKKIEGYDKLAINAKNLSVRNLHILKKQTGAKIVDISPRIEALRSVKTLDEIEIIRKACQITDQIFTLLFKNFSKFKTEKEVKKFLREKTEEFNCRPSFDPIVASGKNASNPHYSGNDVLRKGFCVIDYGIVYKGYCSDVTRTVYNGNPTMNEIEIYKKVLDANTEAITKVKAGNLASEPDFVARKKLGKYEKYFIHSLGHQLGIEVHDEGTLLSIKSKEKLERNMVVTVEPGIYIPEKLGIRIEDDILVLDGKAQILTNVTKKLKILQSKNL